jgi:hypothetical protein
VGDAEHYKGRFDEQTQQWNADFPPGIYLGLTLAVASAIPMGLIGFAVKLLYLDAVEHIGLDQPEGFDPTGLMIRERLNARGRPT